MKKSCEIMRDIMGAIVETEEWNRIQFSDPVIQRAEDEFRSLLKQVDSPEVETKLSDACTALISAFADAATLYGIQVANAIRDIADDPCVLSRFYMERAEAAEE